MFTFFSKLLSTNTDALEAGEVNNFIEKVEVLVQAISNDILSERYLEGYEKIICPNIRNKITKMVFDKIKKKGSRQ